MEREPLTLRLRGDAAIRLLVSLKAKGFEIPLSLVVGAQEPGAVFDVVADAASLARDPTVVAVLRAPGAEPVVWVTIDDAPATLAGLLLTEGYAPSSARDRRVMRSLVGWLLRPYDVAESGWSISPPILRHMRTELTGLRDGTLRGPSPQLDEVLSEEIWHLDPQRVAVAVAEALDAATPPRR